MEILTSVGSVLNMGEACLRPGVRQAAFTSNFKHVEKRTAVDHPRDRR